MAASIKQSPSHLQGISLDAAKPDFEDAAAFGNKTANLAKLKRVLASDPRAVAARSAVPDFCGLSHQLVYGHLTQHAGREFAAALGELNKSLQPGVQPLSGQARAKLGLVRALVHKTFAEHPLAVDQAFVGRHAQHRLMVRSTGKEDSEALPNAGGNESVANVEPSAPAVAEAIGRVVASYFSERSYAQRLLAGDDVHAPPFMPVLLQVMVGETASGHIPSSGVMFTKEPEGPTPHVTQIQSTLGHNEAVVAGLLPADT
ncbi:MAG: hypothetical protein EOO40_07490, partial [Deltaproteobacteria bacterium]